MHFIPRSIAAALLVVLPSVSHAEGIKVNVVEGKSRPELAIVVAGEVQGGFGTNFRTDVTLINRRSVDQQVIVRWLPRDQNGTAIPGVPITLRANAFFPLRDFVRTIGQTGIGAVVITTVNSDGTFDANGQIDGFARIYTDITCGATTGTVSQAEQSVITSQFFSSDSGVMLGLRQDADFRTNVGIVNLDASAHTFDVAISGQGAGASMTVTLQPRSMSQLPIPAGNYGDLIITARGRIDAGAWHAYASSIDNRTGDGWIALAGD